MFIAKKQTLQIMRHVRRQAFIYVNSLDFGLSIQHYPRGENASLRVSKLVGKSVANSWLARVG